jgi:hypothetical protein
MEVPGNDDTRMCSTPSVDRSSEHVRPAPPPPTIKTGASFVMVFLLSLY